MEACENCKQLEAKLAAAVEALEQLRDGASNGMDRQLAHAALAKIRGRK